MGCNRRTKPTRLAAIDTLGAEGAKIPGAVDALTEQFRSKSAKVRVRALEALAQLGPVAQAAAPKIAPLLADPNFHVRRAAIPAYRAASPMRKPPSPC